MDNIVQYSTLFAAFLTFVTSLLKFILYIRNRRNTRLLKRRYKIRVWKCQIVIFIRDLINVK